jgi:SAM-dependent methyltransferase
VDEIGERNRERFDHPDAVAAYRAMTDLTPAEQHCFAAHIPVGARILDLGVGTGRTTPWLHQRASRYLGIDVAPAMVDAARALHPGVELEVGDATALTGLGDGEFDVVVFSFNGIDYLSDADRALALREVHRVLAPGGTFVLSTHQPRAVVATPPAEGPVLRRAAVAVVGTLRRARRLVPTAAFRTGEGWVLDPAKGGLLTHHATPRHVVRELDAHGFAVVEQVPGDHPRRAAAWRTPWWYYVATRR